MNHECAVPYMVISLSQFELFKSTQMIRFTPVSKMFPIKQAHPLVAEGDDLSNYT